MKKTYHPGPAPVTSEQRIILMNDKQWEGFLADCCDQLLKETQYVNVKPLGGPGDKGRDIACYTVFPSKAKTWDMYQAKAYKDPITPANILPDLAKLLYYVFNGDYSAPRSYFICGTKNVGTSLFDLLKKPEKLKEYVIENWKKKKGDLGSFKQPLTPDLEKFINGFDFAIVKEKKVSELLTIHSRSAKHWSTFGGLPAVVPEVAMPVTPAKEEQSYVTEILKAYEDFEKSPVPSVDDIPGKHTKHFENCRRQFYYAEGLNRFSRDYVPDAFDDLLVDVRVGISPVVDDATHTDGLKRLNETLKQATALTATTNPLKERIRSQDLQGACHHLANNGEVKWVPDE